MRRSPWLMMMLAALLVWWAARVVPPALGLATAAVRFGGTTSVGGASPLVSCSASVSPTSVKKPTGFFPTWTTVTVICTNKLEVPVTVTLSAGTFSGSGTTKPTTPLAWNPASIQLTAASGATPSAQSTRALVVQTGTSTGNYTFTFTTMVDLISTKGFYYNKSHTVAFTVTN